MTFPGLNVELVIDMTPAPNSPSGITKAGGAGTTRRVFVKRAVGTVLLFGLGTSVSRATINENGGQWVTVSCYIPSKGITKECQKQNIYLNHAINEPGNGLVEVGCMVAVPGLSKGHYCNLMTDGDCAQAWTDGNPGGSSQPVLGVKQFCSWNGVM